MRKKGRKEIGNSTNKEVIKNLITDEYELKARHLFLQGECPIIPVSGEKHLHLVAVGDSPMMRAAVRQAVLLAHFPNYNDDNGKNRTMVTWLTDDVEKLYKELMEGASGFGNLLKYCRHTKLDEEPENKDSFIDVEFCFRPLSQEWLGTLQQADDEQLLVMYLKGESENLGVSQEQRKEIDEASLKVEQPDLTRAKYLNMVYDMAGSYFNEISPMHKTLVHDIQRPINNICKNLTEKRREENWNELKDDKNKLSNLYCGDNFELRVDWILNNGKVEDLKEAVKERCLELSRTEHARWNVEKLINGFRPYTPEELEADALILSCDKRKELRNRLKKRAADPAHIDLCTCHDIRHRNPSSFKYDAFLVLAMPSIMEVTKKK